MMACCRYSSPSPSRTASTIFDDFDDVSKATNITGRDADATLEAAASKEVSPVCKPVYPSVETSDENWEDRAGSPGSSGKKLCDSGLASLCPSSEQESLMFSMGERSSDSEAEEHNPRYHPSPTKHQGASDATITPEAMMPPESTAHSCRTAPPKAAAAPLRMTPPPKATIRAEAEATIPLNIPSTQYIPYTALVEEIHPPRIVTVGSVIRLITIRVDVEWKYFSRFYNQCLTLLVELKDADDQSDRSSALRYPSGNDFGQGKALLKSKQPSTFSDDWGRSILRFYFYIDSLRVGEQGSYRFHYTAMIPSVLGEAPTMQGTCFVTDDCPEFTFDEMVSIEAHAGTLRRFWNGSCQQIEVITKSTKPGMSYRSDRRLPPPNINIALSPGAELLATGVCRPATLRLVKLSFKILCPGSVVVLKDTVDTRLKTGCEKMRGSFLTLMERPGNPPSSRALVLEAPAADTTTSSG
ncbi:hypothetical protein J7T55_012013 [Diaporthe amygdali]|uniref:uncharacterized protein n=1 Tax=Phomopsis amygdali TaxID=1214568 RepID=UPI0022FE7C0B|nr:uncharacterized protein J7T55_012013 [Diaporthe amygdali]KAJ0123548.1 hypothetical protein J7T55_012013 [Diaporthe amygdali]